MGIRVSGVSAPGKKLDQAFADAPEKIFAFGAGLLENFWLIAVFECDFLEKKFDRIFGLKSLRTQLADAGSETLGIGGGESREMVGAGVFAKLAQGEAVVSSFGFCGREEGGDGIIPVALGAGPALEAVLGDPEDGSGTFRFAVRLSLRWSMSGAVPAQVPGP